MELTSAVLGDIPMLVAQGVVDPAVRTVFERVVKETQGHYALIESEYAHVMGMVHESDQDTFVRE